jgi:hypothetical protein
MFTDALLHVGNVPPVTGSHAFAGTKKSQRSPKAVPGYVAAMGIRKTLFVAAATLTLLVGLVARPPGAVAGDGELHVVAIATGNVLPHAIRFPDGGWTQWGNIKGQAGDPGEVQQIATALVGGDLHVVVTASAGSGGDPIKLYHAIRFAAGNWSSFVDVGTLTGIPNNIFKVAAASVAGRLNVVAYTISNGDFGLFHGVRFSDGSWSAFGDIEPEAGTVGELQDITAASSNDELVVMLVQGNMRVGTRLMYTVQHASGVWVPWDNVGSHVAVPTNTWQVAAAGVQGEIHAVISTSDGFFLYHAIFHRTGWTTFGDVKKQTGNPGSIVDIAAASVSGNLNVVVSTSVRRWFHTIRFPDHWTAFGDISPQIGNSNAIFQVGAAG